MLVCFHFLSWNVNRWEILHKGTFSYLERQYLKIFYFKGKKAFRIYLPSLLKKYDREHAGSEWCPFSLVFYLGEEYHELEPKEKHSYSYDGGLS